MNSYTPGSAIGSRSGSISSSLLERVRNQEPEAWQRLVYLFGPCVYRWSRRSGLQAADAADVVQEVFQAVSVHLAHFHRDQPGTSFSAWLWTIAQNKIHDYFRRRQARAEVQGEGIPHSWLAQLPEPPKPAAEGPPHASPLTDAEHRAVEMVRAGIEPRTWEAFWRVVAEGQSVAGVAKDLGMTVRAVYDAKYRVARKLRQELEGLLEP